MVKKFAKGLLFGTAVGGIVATFLAPKSGKETRADITNEVNDSKQAVTTVVNSIQGVKNNTARVKKELMNLEKVQGETEERLADFNFETEPLIGSIKEQIEKIQKQLDK